MKYTNDSKVPGAKAVDLELDAETKNKVEDTEVTDNEAEDTSLLMSQIASIVDSGGVAPGSLGGVVIDVSGVRGGTLSRLYASMKSGGTVIVDPSLVNEYEMKLRGFFGNGKKNGKRVVYTR